MNRRVLVTGYGGFLGSEICRQLLAAGDQVVGLGRGVYGHLRGLKINTIQGDIQNSEIVHAAVKNVDAVIHTAAIAGVWGPWELYYGINTIGTENVIKACRAAGAKVLIYCSSPSVTFDGRDQAGIDESVGYPTRWLCHYPHTKALAEQAVLTAHQPDPDQPDQLLTAALRPHLIWGADDPHLFPRLIARAKQGRLRIVGSGNNQIDTVHVANAAAAHLNALDVLWGEREQSTSAAGGRAYFITQDEPVQCWDWIAQVLDTAGVPMPKRRISYRAAWYLGHTLELIYGTLGCAEEPPMTRFVAAQLAQDHYFDISAAKTLLGYKPQVSNEQGLEELRRCWNAC